MIEETYASEQIAEITDFVDVEALPEGETTHLLFGTNQVMPVDIAAERYSHGLAPLVIVTGGINRHDGIVEGQVFHRLLIERGVPAAAIRTEDRSANTWQNVEFSLPYLQEALGLGHPITVVCKWFHRRAIHCLRTLLPDVGPFYAITYEPIYSGVPITRDNWSTHPDGRQRILREWQEVSRRVSDHSFAPLTKAKGAWH
jgi:uncharacterized SAM-binding protein YcdF (DUF218 family)